MTKEQYAMGMKLIDQLRGIHAWEFDMEVVQDRFSRVDWIHSYGKRAYGIEEAKRMTADLRDGVGCETVRCVGGWLGFVKYGRDWREGSNEIVSMMEDAIGISNDDAVKICFGGMDMTLEQKIAELVEVLENTKKENA